MYIMENDKLKAKEIMNLISSLPYFRMADLAPFVKNRSYLRIILSRCFKSGKILRLKKGVYVSRNYLSDLEKKNGLPDYAEFLANMLYGSSYLSLEYVLYENNLLTDSPKNITSVSLNGTISFSNSFGRFLYHKIKKELFVGFSVIKKGSFTILKASKMKALFDFLYLRKNILTNEESISELRLNLGSISPKERKELEKYVNMEGSNKLKDIFNKLKWKY